MMRTLLSVPLILSFTLAPALEQAKPPASFETVNVCERLPVDAVAAAVGGRPLDAKPVNVKDMVAARCVYGIEIDKRRQAFVVWLNPPADYEGLRNAAEGPVTPLPGIGDQAYGTFDKDTKRQWVRAVKRGAVTIQVSGEKLEAVQSIAKVALSKF